MSVSDPATETTIFFYSVLALIVLAFIGFGINRVGERVDALNKRLDSIAPVVSSE